MNLMDLVRAIDGALAGRTVSVALELPTCSECARGAWATVHVAALARRLASRRYKLLRIRQWSPADAQVSLDDVEPLIAALREITEAS